MNTLETMPDDARLWVYGLDRPLTADETERVQKHLAAFASEWTSHGARVTGACDVVEGRFVLMSGFCADGISGCSTDSSVAAIRMLASKFGVNGLDRSLVFFREANGTISALSRVDFQREVDAGRITPDTTVFDTTLQTVADLRAGRFETAFRDCWHARAFG